MINLYVILQTFGRVAERSNATDCKSVVSRLRWFESIPFHQILCLTRNRQLITADSFCFREFFVKNLGQILGQN